MHKLPESLTEHANKVAAMYTKAAEQGRGFQTRNHRGEWVNCTAGPNMNSDLSKWRVAPRHERIWYAEIKLGQGTIQSTTTKENEAQNWRDQGYEVFEYKVS
jgi:hypothetical protein